MFRQRGRKLQCNAIVKLSETCNGSSSNINYSAAQMIIVVILHGSAEAEDNRLHHKHFEIMGDLMPKQLNLLKSFLTSTPEYCNAMPSMFCGETLDKISSVEN